MCTLGNKKWIFYTLKCVTCWIEYWLRQGFHRQEKKCTPEVTIKRWYKHGSLYLIAETENPSIASKCRLVKCLNTMSMG